MKISDFEFNLPEQLIAQEPSGKRDHSRLLVADRKSGSIEHRHFFQVTDFLKSGDLLVINDTRVIPARLSGRKRTGGSAEAFLLERDYNDGHIWECLIGGKRVRPGTLIDFDGSLKGEVLEEIGGGRFKLRFHADRPFDDVLEEVGEVPLPPYIKRAPSSRFKVQSSELGVQSYPIPSLDHSEHKPLTGQGESGFDKDRYQTVFAEKKGAVAAPTAGLHFTEALLKKIKDMGVDIAPVTLHVGPGTFLPVRVENIEEHRMLPESYEISAASAEKINRAKAEGRRVVAVGSTSMRTLEAAATTLSPPYQGEGGVWQVIAGTGKTDIFIYPGYVLKIVDVLITNFHLPRSTLLMLVSAFAGKELISRAYREAIENKYRFYSYGDAMMIL